MKAYLILLFLVLFSPSTLFALSVKTKADEVANSIQFEGVVEPGKVYVFVLRPGETIAQFFVEKGQDVKVGDPLLNVTNEHLFSLFGEIVERKINGLKLKNSVEKLKIVLGSLKKRKKSLGETLAKMDKLAAKGFDISMNDRILTLREKYHDLSREIQLTQKEIELQESMNGIYGPIQDSNEQMALSLQKRIDNLQVKSIIEGVVKSVHREPNRAVAGDKALEIWDTSTIRINASVSQNHVDYLKVGDEVKIYYDYFSKEHELGKVAEIGDGISRVNSGGQRKTVFPVIIEPLKHRDIRIGNEVIIKMDIE